MYTLVVTVSSRHPDIHKDPEWQERAATLLHAAKVEIARREDGIAAIFAVKLESPLAKTVRLVLDSARLSPAALIRLDLWGKGCIAPVMIWGTLDLDYRCEVHVEGPPKNMSSLQLILGNGQRRRFEQVLRSYEKACRIFMRAMSIVRCADQAEDLTRNHNLPAALAKIARIREAVPGLLEAAGGELLQSELREFNY